MQSSDEASTVLWSPRALMEQDASAALVMFERAALLAVRSRDLNVQADAELGWGEALYSLDGRKSESLVHLHRAAVLGTGTVIEALAWLIIADVHSFCRYIDETLVAYSTSAQLLERLYSWPRKLVLPQLMRKR